MNIELSPQELIMAAHYAALIEGVKSVQVKSKDVRNKRISKQSDFAIHYAGMLGEIAVSRSLGANLRTEITFGGDGGLDLDIKGHSIQVKTSTHAKTPDPRFLIFNDLDDFSTEWAFSCSIQSPSVVKIHGFVSKKKFERLAEPHDFGYGNRLCLNEKHLAPVEKFFEAIA